jgi:formate dehydrogenase subunit gamma
MSSDVVARPGTAIPEDQIVRYTLRERVCHWINGLTYTYCLLTGLALFTPYLYWLAAVFGGGPTIRFWHPWVGVAFMISMIWMHSIWRRDMQITNVDRRWMKDVKYYVENREELVPPAERFNAGQKWFYWVMFYGAIVLLITGIVMWIPETILGSLHWVLPVVVVIHVIAALVTIAGFIIHVYMGVFLVKGGLKGILHGTVSRQWARVHHRLWYEKTTGYRTGR